MRVLVLCLLALPATGWAQRFEIDPARSSAGFDISHLLVARAHGTIRNITGTAVFDDATPANARVSARLEVATIDTGDAGRDAHLRTADYLDAERFPAITFQSTSVLRVAPDRYQVAGLLTLHGVRRGSTLEVTLVEEAGVRRARARTVVHRKHHGVTGGWILVGDDAEVTLDIVLVPA